MIFGALLLVGVGSTLGASMLPAAVNPHPVHPVIAWQATRKLVSGSGCAANYSYTVRITGSTEYLNEHIQTFPGTHYAGKKAVVELFGPDYPSHPRETKTIRPDGTFTVAYRRHTCAARRKAAGLAMVMVGRFDLMYPSLANTVP